MKTFKQLTEEIYSQGGKKVFYSKGEIQTRQQQGNLGINVTKRQKSDPTMARKMSKLAKSRKSTSAKKRPKFKRKSR
jgi:hypothetical protein